MLRKSFGEAISNLVMSRDEPNIKTLFHDLIPNEMIINFNMLHVSMEDLMQDIWQPYYHTIIER
jgi:hypothetical protein